MIATGGTGGHIYPALALADTIRKNCPECEIRFFGSDNRMEAQVIPAAGYAFAGMTMSGMNGGILAKVKSLISLQKAERSCRKMLKEFQPEVCIGFGNYISVPLIRAAHKLGIPTMISEQNSSAGKANLYLSRIADAIEAVYPSSLKEFPEGKTRLYGNPEASAAADEKAKAKAAAEAMLKSCKNIEDLKTVGTNAKNAGTVRDAGTVPVQKGKMVPDFEAWAYEASRKEGEMAVIYAKEYGYFCVGYNGKVELDASEKQEMATKALSAEIDTEIKAGKYGIKYEGTAPKTNKNSNVLVIVFASVGGAAIILVVAILIMNSVKNNKGNGKKSSGSKKTGSGKKSSKGKSGKSK